MSSNMNVIIGVSLISPSAVVGRTKPRAQL
jgi:hypothetical protein